MATATVALETDLDTQLRTSRETLARLIDTQDQAQTLLGNLERAVAAAAAAATAEAENALIDGRSADAKVLAALAPAQAKFAAAESRLATTRGAVARQGAEVQRLTDLIASEGRARMLAGVQPLAKRMGVLMDELGVVASNLMRQSQGHQLHACDLFQGERDQTMAGLKVAVLNQTLQVEIYRRMFDGKVA